MKVNILYSNILYSSICISRKIIMSHLPSQPLDTLKILNLKSHPPHATSSSLSQRCGLQDKWSTDDLISRRPTCRDTHSWVSSWNVHTCNDELLCFPPMASATFSPVLFHLQYNGAQQLFKNTCDAFHNPNRSSNSHIYALQSSAQETILPFLHVSWAQLFVIFFESAQSSESIEPSWQLSKRCLISTSKRSEPSSLTIIEQMKMLEGWTVDASAKTKKGWVR